MFNLGLAAWAMWPNPELDLDDDEDDDDNVPSNKQWEMQPTTPRMAVPFTPRTQAFHTLDRRLPLRSD